MRSSDDRTSVPNIFSSEFLEVFHRRDESITAEEAELAGPWAVQAAKGGFGVFRGLPVASDETPESPAPEGVLKTRGQALLMAATLPGVGREPLYYLNPESKPEGYTIETVWGDRGVQPVGHLRIFQPKITDALHIAEAIARSPESLANLMEAAGATALEIAGQILARRLAAGGGEEE
jgi:hypothetical protein